MLRRRERQNAARESLRDAIEASERLRTRLSSVEAGLDALAEGIVVLDAAGEVSFANPAARELTGRPFRSAQELVPTVLREACRDALAQRRSVALEVETRGRNLQAEVIVGAREGVGAVLILRDVTAARRNDRVQRDFVANASHELKTPVSSIIALAEALQEAVGNDEAAVQRFLGLLDQESVRLSRLVNDLLDLSRLEGALPAPVSVAFHRVVTEEANRLRPRAEAAGLQLLVEQADAATVLGSEADLGLLVHNLLDNAIRYSRPGDTVRVSLQTEGGHAALWVDDTGAGIASRDLDRIFERFYRADPARSRETGATGLGLSIVKHVAEAHGGDVAVRSVLGAGSTFTVRLPLADSAPA